LKNGRGGGEGGDRLRRKELVIIQRKRLTKLHRECETARVYRDGVDVNQCGHVRHAEGGEGNTHSQQD